MKAFRTPNDTSISLFRPEMNARRMAYSSTFVSIPPIPTSHFMTCVHLAVSANAAFVPPHASGGALYVRPLVFGSCAQLALAAPEEYTFVVYVMPTGVYHGVHPVDALILEDFDRAAPEGVGSAKLGGNYAPVLRHSDKARAEGYGITLHLDSRTRSEIDEFSTSGFIGIKEVGQDNYELVVPDSKQVIESVTSESVCELARSFGWTVAKRPIKYEEIRAFDEVMAAGTAAALVPIKSITMRSRNDKFTYLDEEPGPLCMKLLTTLQGIQRGKIEDTFGWCSKVEAPDAYGHNSKQAPAPPHENGDPMGSISQLP